MSISQATVNRCSYEVDALDARRTNAEEAETLEDRGSLKAQKDSRFATVTVFLDGRPVEFGTSWVAPVDIRRWKPASPIVRLAKYRLKNWHNAIRSPK